MVLIKSQRDTLLAPLQSVSGIVERRHTLPILSNVLLEKKGDHEQALTCWEAALKLDGARGDIQSKIEKSRKAMSR